MKPTAAQPVAPAPPAAAETDAAPLMRRLREHTAAMHAATEELPLMRAVLTATPASYSLYLATLHGIYTAVEPTLYAALPLPLRDALGIAPKLPALQRDLAALGESIPAHRLLPPADVSMRCRRLLPPDEPSRTATTLGGLYVLEGATLGGQLIARRLRARWTATTPLPTSFLDFRATHAGGDWRGFGAALSTWAAQHPGSEQAILDGALAVFETMHAGFAEVDA